MNYIENALNQALRSGNRWSNVSYGGSKTINQQMRQAGYHNVEIGQVANWASAQRWCRRTFGQDHYTWHGADFWFENEQDAVLFALRWA